MKKAKVIGLQPLPAKPGMIEVKGDELLEAFMFAADRNRDWLLLRAKRELARAKQEAKCAKGIRLSDSELRGISWFAHLPDCDHGKVLKAVFNEADFCASSFWRVWVREPMLVLKLTERIRQNPPEKDLEKFLQNNQKFTVLGPDSIDEARRKRAQQKRIDRASKSLKPSDAVATFVKSITRE